MTFRRMHGILLIMNNISHKPWLKSTKQQEQNQEQNIDQFLTDRINIPTAVVRIVDGDCRMLQHFGLGFSVRLGKTNREAIIYIMCLLTNRNAQDILQKLAFDSDDISEHQLGILTISPYSYT